MNLVYTHTVCLRQDVNCGAGPMCGSSYRPIPLNDDDRRFIVDLHNTLRNQVATGQEMQGPQPSASNMNALSYNKELEYIAQCTTNSCNYAHDTCRKTSKFDWVGQNIAKRLFIGTLGDSRYVMNISINSWYNEVKDFNPAWLSNFQKFPKKVGHYSQVVWANTKEIGCGITFYVVNDENTYFLACNYGPGGNIQTLPIYNVGQPASECNGESPNPRFPGLCGPDNV